MNKTKKRLLELKLAKAEQEANSYREQLLQYKAQEVNQKAIDIIKENDVDLAEIYLKKSSNEPSRSVLVLHPNVKTSNGVNVITGKVLLDSAYNFDYSNATDLVRIPNLELRNNTSGIIVIDGTTVEVRAIYDKSSDNYKLEELLHKTAIRYQDASKVILELLHNKIIEKEDEK